MSFDRANLAYRSLPHNHRSQKTVNFAMPQSQTQTQPLTQTSKISIPINNGGISSSSTSSLSTSGVQTQTQPQLSPHELQDQQQQQQQNNSTSKVPVINTEEFAKLDALLEDLLAEVEQPILLNKDGVVSSGLSSNKRVNSYNDGLNYNHNKENYRINSTRHINGNDDLERSVDWLNEQKERLRSRKELVNMYTSKHTKPDYVVDDPQNYRKIKSKLDYYVTNSNGQYQTNSLHKSLSTQAKNGFAYTSNGNGVKTNGYHVEQLEDDQSPTIMLNGSENGQFVNGVYLNKPPASPNNVRYTPQPASNSAPFRSLSTNPTLLRNITENDDLIEPDFDRYSQRSFRSNTSTVQRTKYHTVSNDFVDCTKPTAPTPVPTYQTNKANYPSKRALSAPPTEMGKVVLQRMELKSPLTVRQGSVVPFQHQIAYHPQEQLVQRVQTPVNGTLTRQYIDNGRVVLKPNNNYNNVIQPQQPTTSINCPPTRNVFLNRAYSETPRVGYTNGYETDSGIARTNSYNNSRTQYNTFNQQMIESESMNGYNTNGYRNISNGYRTIQTPSRAYNVSLQSGYETDSGLVKLRQVLDNTRRAPSRNNIPIQHQQVVQPQFVTNQNGAYYYPSRSITPSFNSCYTQQQQQQQLVPQQYSSEPISTTHTQQYIVTTYPNDIETIEFIDNPEFTVQPMSPQIQQTFQYTNSNSNGVVEKISGYIGQDGRPIILNDVIEQSTEDLNGLMPAPQSVIVQQQVAPSAYQPNEQMDDTNNELTTGSMIQINRETPSRLTGVSASANNISTLTNGQQASTRQDSRRSSANSLADSTEILRNHPKSVKSTQNYWYKPKISRDEAINLLKDKPPGTFLIRDSNNFPGAYGLALKVDKPPPNVQLKPGADPLNELVRHFLIEPTSKGVRIKGCYNEPIFGSLAALVYQHSLTPLALPIKLILPVRDLVLTINDPQPQQQQQQQQQNHSKTNGSSVNSTPKQSNQQQLQDARHLLEKGAACNVYYLSTVNIDNKNGIEAISAAVSANKSFQSKDSSQLLLIQFKVTAQGITLTDLNRKKFLRQHFPTNTVIYCAIEEKQMWPTKLERIAKPRIFGVITKPQVKSGSNECHLFVELDPDQPAIAIVDFINRYLIPSKTDNNKN